MNDLVYIRTALVSVSDKTDLVPFVRHLENYGIAIISTGGTARILTEAEIPVTPIEKITGFPEMMDGRVKTLHPKVHGGLLAVRDKASHTQALQDHHITPIDLVCVNLYPFERTVADPDVSEENAIEQIDIGGPSMVRSSAKNHRYVTCVTDPNQYDEVTNVITENNGASTLALRRKLAAAAFTRTADYDHAISHYMTNQWSISPTDRES